MQSKIVAGALGNCVHVAGVYGFLRSAEEAGMETVFLGAAVDVESFVDSVREHNPEIVGVSYRLTPEVGGRLLRDLISRLREAGLVSGRRFAFGGTPPMCREAQELGFFERCFDGLESPADVWAYLRCETAPPCEVGKCESLVARIEQKHPYPLLRHHFGLPGVKETIKGVAEIAASGVVDVISLAPDQNAQESFFRPSEMDSSLDGAGGVAVRSEEDLRQIYAASRTGNYPLLGK